MRASALPPAKCACSLVVLCLCPFVARTAYSQGPPALKRSEKALLIGIEKYQKASPLQFVGNDVDQLAITLRDRGSYEVATIIDSARPTAGPVPAESERDALMQQVDSWLNGVGADDAVLLYFSGHGFRDKDGQLFLAAVDCDPADPAPSGVPMQWLRERLVKCQCRSKLLILDACHAGSAKGLAVPAKELNGVLENINGLTTLAACGGDESSYLWPEKKQSLFSYFLGQGLKGHADTNPRDDEITVNELHTFVNAHVPKVAQSLLGMEQTPTRIQGPNVARDVILRPKPYNLKALLDDMAEQMDLLMRREKISVVGIIPRFAYDTGEGLALGVDYGTSPSYLAAEMANRLGDKKGDAYRVVNPNAMEEILRGRSVTPSEIGTSKTKGLSVEATAESVKLPAIVTGIIVGRHKDRFQVQCQLLGTDWYDTIGTAGGTASLNEQELAMLGISFRVTPEDRRPEAPRLGAYSSATEQLAGHVHARLEQPEDVLAVEQFPFGVEIRVKEAGGYRKRPATFQDGRYVVHLRTRDVYGIWLTNRSKQIVFARVLVDGLNTLPEKSQCKDVFVESADRATDAIQAPPVNLSEARAWVLAPPPAGATETTYAIRGFYASEGEKDPYNEFVVVDATEAVAAQRGYTKQLGLITVAFYTAVDKQTLVAQRRSRGGGTGFGHRYDDKLDAYAGEHVPGNLIAVVHIQYVE